MKNANLCIFGVKIAVSAYFELMRQLVQLNPAITDFRGPTIFIHYRWISAIANIGIKGKILQGTEKLLLL